MSHNPNPIAGPLTATRDIRFKTTVERIDGDLFVLGQQRNMLASRGIGRHVVTAGGRIATGA
jgi:hypothetical protein